MFNASMQINSYKWQEKYYPYFLGCKHTSRRDGAWNVKSKPVLYLERRLAAGVRQECGILSTLRPFRSPWGQKRPMATFSLPRLLSNHLCPILR